VVNADIVNRYWITNARQLRRSRLTVFELRKVILMKRMNKIVAIGLLNLVLLAALPTLAGATARSTSEIKKDLRATENEYKKFKSLRSKLDSAAKQSSNTARETAVHNLQDFMGECIRRRESDLSDVITIKQHGEMVKSGTTDVAKAGAPVPGNTSAKGQVYSSSNADRARQLSGMKSIYVGAKNNSRPAIERQQGAFERYTETIGKFGQQLEWGVKGMSNELAQREADAEAKAKAEKEKVEGK